MVSLRTSETLKNESNERPKHDKRLKKRLQHNVNRLKHTRPAKRRLNEKPKHDTNCRKQIRLKLKLCEHYLPNVRHQKQVS